ncbi:MAG: ATP-binding protein [Candidatus Nitrohelix vancouverensis]|uniref:ATP-binding protein n=1 Tax=Candidatus Nitrohelix vancouverensis TaxID=2705534 RepID=A0A7T0C1B8_9BACT|nr:MAG: ATP-binding protein [Candidatus Nitrohelix vancouverensis]
MKQPIRLTIPSDPRFLCVNRKALQQILKCYEAPEELAGKLALCVDEACSNVIKYSYEGETGHSIEICYKIEDDVFEVSIRDYGKQCDASEFKPRCLDDVKPGGLGTFFINQIMDNVTYCTNREKGTLLTMTKDMKKEMSATRERVV